LTPRDLVLTPRGIRFMGRYFPSSVGHAGVTRQKREGDGATPAGVHRIMGMYYRPDRMARPNGWAIPLQPGDLWSDDPDDPAYNRLVRSPHPHGHEAMRRPDPLYDVVLVTDWNRHPRAVPGAGSAIFVHVWRAPRHPTAGCIALAKPALCRIIRQIAPGTRLIVK